MTGVRYPTFIEIEVSPKNGMELENVTFHRKDGYNYVLSNLWLKELQVTVSAPTLTFCRYRCAMFATQCTCVVMTTRLEYYFIAV